MDDKQHVVLGSSLGVGLRLAPEVIYCHYSVSGNVFAMYLYTNLQ